jgi:hypothetical protein
MPKGINPMASARHELEKFFCSEETKEGIMVLDEAATHIL